MYAFILGLRHKLYDWGWKKSCPTEVPSVCVGNVAVGGTGKTPMAELIIRTLTDGNVETADSDIYGFQGPDPDFHPRKIAVLSRGYKRKSRGFQQVSADGTVKQYGDEPLQIKRKFPEVTVVVDKNRTQGADFLAHPEHMDSLKPKKKARIINPQLERPDVIILDDAFQHRKVKANGTVVLTTFDHPFTEDRLMPLGRLRDLRSRALKADVMVVTKCPLYVDQQIKEEFATGRLGFESYDPQTCEAVTKKGRRLKLLFATTAYDKPKAVFPDGDPHYIHAPMAVIVTGIADDQPFVGHMGDFYKIMSHKVYPDHHNYTKGDMRAIADIARHTPLAVIATTEKDAQRMRDVEAPQELRRRLFYAPIRMQMLTAQEQNVLKEFLINL